MAGDLRTIRVDLAERGYDILIGQGLLRTAGDLIRPLLRRPRLFVIADARVAALHLPTLQASLEAADVRMDVVSVAPGEGSKSFAQLEAVLDSLIEAGAERQDMIAAFGGGVIGDLAGLAAALLKRGVRFVQIPTTLLAQVDSSVGGKTAVNSRAGKNLVGVFHQPSLVLADLSLLATLPARELAAGLAEVVKYALIDDAPFFERLWASASALRAGDAGALGDAVATSCAAKARIVAADETEQGVRALLNLGHTFAHALERANGYADTLLHGEAVACGLVLAARFSAKLGLAPASDAARTEELLSELGLATRLADLPGAPHDPDALTAHMAHDKKARDGKLTLILTRGVGQSFIAPDVDADAVRRFLKEEVQRPALKEAAG
ncbi:3-dehydroquinate synthase [bacterium]|nr:3-dehydroquinate synthase [bacterium]